MNHPDELVCFARELALNSGAPPNVPPVDNRGASRDDGNMEQRLTALEQANFETRDRLARIETQMGSIASKEDVALTKSALQQVINDQTWKFVTWTTTIAIALIGATFTVAKLIH